MRFSLTLASLVALSFALSSVTAGTSALADTLTFAPYGPSAGLTGDTQGAEFGNGAAVVDVDGDGDLDLYVTDGDGRPNRLFTNGGSFDFTEVSGALGAAAGGESKGAAFADFDNDGDPDLAVAHWGSSTVLYQNEAGAFVDVSAGAGVPSDTYYSTGLTWGDADGDGLLDLYVANRGLTEIGEPNQFFHSQSGGVFDEVGAEAGLDSWHMTFQPIFTDFDRDGDLDLYLANDRLTVNELFRNDGNLVFTDVAPDLGADLAMDAMGVDAADLNGDGRFDYYVTNTQEGNRLLLSQPNGTFVESAGPLGIAVYEVGWGCVFFDADLDGDEDLFEVNMIDNPNKLFRNDGIGVPFADITASAGVAGTEQSFGATAADFDGDGDRDLYVSNRGVCEVYRNELVTTNHWIAVECQGTWSNRDGIGAIVEISGAGGTQVREIRAGSSYLSQVSRRAMFGVGSATTVDLRVWWPSGAADHLAAVPVDAIVQVTEGATVTIDGTPASGVAAPRLLAAPNPFSGALTLSAELRQPAAVVLRIVDVQGRAVFGRELGPQPAGSFVWTWDGRAAGGQRVSSGTYWLELRAGDQHITTRVSALP